MKKTLFVLAATLLVFGGGFFAGRASSPTVKTLPVAVVPTSSYVPLPPSVRPDVNMPLYVKLPITSGK